MPAVQEPLVQAIVEEVQPPVKASPDSQTPKAIMARYMKDHPEVTDADTLDSIVAVLCQDVASEDRSKYYK
jgi:hypothetical protein